MSKIKRKIERDKIWAKRVVGLGIGPPLAYIQWGFIGIVIEAGDIYWENLIFRLRDGLFLSLPCIILIAVLPKRWSVKIIIDYPNLLFRKIGFIRENLE